LTKKRPTKKPRKQLRADAQANSAAFLIAYRQLGSVTAAAERLGVSRSQHYEWLKHEGYAQEFADAQREVAQMLEDEVMRRAVQGIEEPVIYQGELCYQQTWNPKTRELKRSNKPLTVTKYSNSLITFLLKAFNPAKYRDKQQIEVTGSLELIERLNAGRARVAAAQQPPIETNESRA
jgi:hypothetical protein